MNYHEKLKQMYIDWAGEVPETVLVLPPTASNRRYMRIKSGTSQAIGAYNPDLKENRAFIYISGHLKKKGIHVPEIYKESLKDHIYLLEDIGDVTLYDFVEKKPEQEILQIYKQVIDKMPALQIEAAKDMDFSLCYPRSAFDRQSMMWDLNYFKYYFLKLAEIRFSEQDLENDFIAFTKYLCQAPDDFFMFRDFQSRNIMISGDKIFFIDYQGARKGSLQYDLASLLFESRINLSFQVRQELLDYYIRKFGMYSFFNKEVFLRYYYPFVLIRIMQAMGAYGYRGFFEGKSLFLQSIPYAVNNLKWIITKNGSFLADFPVLQDVLVRVTESHLLKEIHDEPEQLTVSLYSFSYRKKIPVDYSGNGGGFVFDCRSLPNPYHDPELRLFTGKDKPIIEFFKDKKVTEDFFDHVKSLVSGSIRKYRENGYMNLMVNFGCTGGRHRSVYMAEKLAKYLRKDFDVKVVLKHRELQV